MRDDPDQTRSTDPSASQTWLKPALPPSSSSDQAAQEETVFAQKSRLLADEPTKMLHPQLAHQVSTPQAPPSGLPQQPSSFPEARQRGPAPSRPPILLRLRRWLDSRNGRIFVPLLALLLGLFIGLSSILWYGLALGGGSSLVLPPAQGNLIIEADKALVTDLVTNDLTKAGLPGQVRNVSVTLNTGSSMAITGDDVYSVLGVNFSRHFTVNVQPYVQSCLLQMRVVSANLSGIPVTGFVQSFQGTINQQLAQKPAGLPSGFTYCAVGVRTQPAGLFVTYQAVPLR